MASKQTASGEWSWRAFLVLLIGGAGLSWWLYLTPASIVQGAVVLVDHDGSTSLLRLPVVSLLQRLALAAGFGFLLLALATCWRRAFVTKVLDALVSDAFAYLRDVAAEVRDLAAAPNRWKLIVLALLTLTGLALRIVSLEAPIRFDEAYSFNVHASTPFLNLISDYTTPNNHVFHNVLMRCSYLVFGDSPLALRLPAFLAGLLVIPAAFWCLRRTLGDGAALVAAAFAANSWALIGYSTNARGYTAVTLLLLIAFSLATRLRERRNFFVWALFVIALTLGFFTVPVMLYGASAVGVWLLLASEGRRRKEIVWELAAAASVVIMLTCMLYTPIAIRVGINAIVANPFVSSLPFTVFWNGLPGLAASVARFWASPVWLLVVLAIGLAASFLAPGKSGREARLLHAAVLLSVPLIMTAQRVLPFERVFLPFFPVYFGLAAVGLKAVFERLSGWAQPRWQRIMAVAAFAVIAASGVRGVAQSGSRQSVFDDLPSIVARLRAELRDGDVILAAIPLNEPLRYHARRAGLDPRTVKEIRDVRSYAATPSDGTFYVIEEKDPPPRIFVSFAVGRFRVSHPFLKEHFTQPEAAGETPATTIYRLRVKPGGRGPREGDPGRDVRPMETSGK